MNKNARIYIGILLAGIVLIATACPNIVAPPAIKSFTFEVSKNPVLASSVQATVDEENALIVVRLPASVVDYSNLTPTLELETGTTVAGSVPTNYSLTPTPLCVVNSNGLQKIYQVDVGPAIPEAPADALVITEYYAGTGYEYRNALNRWIELTNTSGAAIDLAQYELVKRVRDNGVRRPDKDIVVRLRGTLPAGASFVLYSERLKTSRFTMPVAPDVSVADTTFNTIMDADGDDGYQLVRNGVVLDELGPNGGEGADYYWAKEKRFLRRSGKGPSATWNHLDWIVYALNNDTSDSANTGSLTTPLNPTTARLTYFAFERLGTVCRGVINETAKTVTVAIPPGTDRSAIKVSFGVEGAGATYGSTVLVPGESALNFNATVTITVWAENGSSYTNYAVSVIDARQSQYTTTNYTFDGDVGDTVAIIKTYGAGQGYAGTFSPGTFIEGVLTCKNVTYKYASTTYTDCFFIQDSKGGLLIWTDVGTDEPLGTKLRVYILAGAYNYSMPIISSHGAIQKADA
ncbi:MAG TPA: lamin tail domain-containing protein, partial [Spirochaetia bacterium]|nr:lamin tail domain-containing protein [Spirochaetia bacterium]